MIHLFYTVIGRFACVFALITLCLQGSALGQASPFIPLGDPAYESIRSLQTRNLLAALSPTAQPYTYREVAQALNELGASGLGASVRGLIGYLEDTVRPFVMDSNIGFAIEHGTRLTNNGRLDPLRIGPRGAVVFPNLSGQLHWRDGPIIAQAGFRGDLYWDSDPDGLDAVSRLFMRNDESYVGVMTGRASILVGRIATHWGPTSGTGLLLSDNARSFDALHLRLGSGAVSVRSLVGELDSITGDGRFTGTAGDDSVASGSERRWMMAHRLDWRVSSKLRISFMEAALFSGAGTGLSLKYLNPAQFLALAVDNRPKNDENNALLALGVWARLGPWTLQSQVLIDDFDVFFGDEPTSFAATLNLDRAVRPDLDFRARVEVVASRTYNTFQPEGRWTYLNRGLATQFSDYIISDVGVVWFGRSGRLRLEPHITALWQGERDIRDPYRFDDSFRTILVGTVERTIRFALSARYQLAGRAFARVDAGINTQQNAGHRAGESRVRGVVTGAIGIRWNATARLKGDS